ncbi:unnamed protein product [Knipowitschia caucasica]
MAKRIADKELTDRNWDQEEVGEEAGTFSLASDDVLKNRPIKKAKRRNAGSDADGGSFKGFKGFSLMPSTTSAGSSTFSSFGNGSSFKGFGSLSNGNVTPSFGTFTAPPTSTATTAFNGSISSSVTVDISTKQTNGTALSQVQTSCTSTSNKEYSRQLTALNCSVRDWITKHVNDNPLCDLNPIFKDYEQHLTSIEKKYGAGVANVGSGDKPVISEESAAPPAASISTPTPALFSFGKGTNESTQTKTTTVPAGVTFNFGQKVDSTVLSSFGSKSTAPSFSFSSSSTSTQSPLFGAANSEPTLSFATPKSDMTPQMGETGDEETEEPPKPEVKEVKEEDAFYSKKCKLFYKKDSEFKEKGVGTLHLKQSGEDKTQMIIRADTNLGNILLNIILQSSLPCSRVGKNNVMLVCVPNPTIDDKNPNTPIPLLLRVKTEEDANELLKILEEKKG